MCSPRAAYKPAQHACDEHAAFIPAPKTSAPPLTRQPPLATRLRRHGEVSRAMRNRGIEIFLLPRQEAEAVASPAGGARWDGSQGRRQGEQHAELVQVLALAGVPGAAVPHAMAAAHAAVAAHAARRHRRPPGLRELRRWAALTAALAARGCRFDAALEAAWRQLYVRMEAASSTGADEAAAVAEAAFQAHLQPLLEAQLQGSRSGGDLVLYRPAAWPLPLGVAAFAADSVSACASRDAAVLLLQLAVLAAAELQQRGQMSEAAGLLGSRAAWVHELGLGAAAAMPAAALLQVLQGSSADSSSSSGLTETDDSSESALLCVPAAARVFAERCGPGQHKQRAALIDALSRQVVRLLGAAGAAGGPAELAAQQAERLVSGVLTHPLCTAASSLQQQLAEAVRLPAAARAFLPLGPPALQQLQPFLLAAGVQGAGQGASSTLQQLWQQVQEVSSKVAALWQAVQAAVVLQAAAAAADEAVAAGSATLLQLSCWRHRRPKVRFGDPCSRSRCCPLPLACQVLCASFTTPTPSGLCQHPPVLSTHDAHLWRLPCRSVPARPRRTPPWTGSTRRWRRCRAWKRRCWCRPPAARAWALPGARQWRQRQAPLRRPPWPCSCLPHVSFLGLGRQQVCPISAIFCLPELPGGSCLFDVPCPPCCPCLPAAARRAAVALGAAAQPARGPRLLAARRSDCPLRGPAVPVDAAAQGGRRAAGGHWWVLQGELGASSAVRSPWPVGALGSHAFTLNHPAVLPPRHPAPDGSRSPAWAEAAQRWAAVSEQLDTAAGIAAGAAPPKPLLWKRGGRPLLPRTLQLSDAYCALVALCDAVRCVQRSEG